MSTALGDKIRRLRKEKKYTLDQLAELTDSSKSYIWELENKNPPRPSADKLSRIAEKLGVTIEYLLDDGESVSEEDAADAHFYRKYRKMAPETKAKIRSMVDIWDDDT
jgi:transcriptional regulator with XRE-family HTH domain